MHEKPETKHERLQKEALAEQTTRLVLSMVPQGVKQQHVDVVLLRGMGLSWDLVAEQTGYNDGAYCCNLAKPYRAHIKAIEEHRDLVMAHFARLGAYQLMDICLQATPHLHAQARQGKLKPSDVNCLARAAQMLSETSHYLANTQPAKGTGSPKKDYKAISQRAIADLKRLKQAP